MNGQTYHYKLEDVEATGDTELRGPVSATPRAGEGGGSNDGSASGTRITYGRPEGTLFRIVGRGSTYAVVELVTPGFYAIPNGEGRVRLEVPGFDSRSVAGAPAVPVRRRELVGQR